MCEIGVRISYPQFYALKERPGLVEEGEAPVHRHTRFAQQRGLHGATEDHHGSVPVVEIGHAVLRIAYNHILHIIL